VKKLVETLYKERLSTSYFFIGFWDPQQENAPRSPFSNASNTSTAAGNQ